MGGLEDATFLESRALATSGEVKSLSDCHFGDEPCIHLFHVACCAQGLELRKLPTIVCHTARHL